MQEISIKTHLICTDVKENFDVNWCGKRLKDIKPEMKNDMPIFIVVGSSGRMELNTADFSLVENCAKRLTRPRGHEAVTTDSSRIFIREEDETESLLCVVTHVRTKAFAPMFDKFQCY